MDRVTETPAQWMPRIEKCRQSNAQRENAKEGKVERVTVVPTIVFIKKEDIEPDPESSASECMVVKNFKRPVIDCNRNLTFHSHQKVKKDEGDTIPVEPTVVIKEEPIEFDPEPSAYADTVTKEELAVSDEEQTQSSTDVSPVSELPSRVTLPTACLGSSQKPVQ
ncbi:hypothetical protein CDAR_442401 [Caerostris darwini]|uniref:Uncharacterized protein n=1 Tax=Caerostris darwini TaxID=1538125 RepID=A0AAV4V0P8_9ARAC|nr:hypothetical protein CDAR_442401 [Caerostris darwini]